MVVPFLLAVLRSATVRPGHFRNGPYGVPAQIPQPRYAGRVAVMWLVMATSRAG
jgi:hypothetical protein